jgi:hypothetical protein
LKQNHKSDLEEILQNSINIDGLRQDQRKALMVLVILKQDFPLILGGSFQNCLLKKGIKITYAPSHINTVPKYIKGFFK